MGAHKIIKSVENSANLWWRPAHMEVPGRTPPTKQGNTILPLIPPPEKRSTPQKAPITPQKQERKNS